MNGTVQRRAPGLTLIETLVALLVVGVLVAIAAPSMQQFIAAQRVKGVNAELVTDLQFARSEASRRNRDVHIRFRAAGNCYTVFLPDVVALDCNCANDPGVDVCSGTSEEIKTVRVPSSTGVAINATATGEKIIFEPRSGQQRVLNEFRVSVTSANGGNLRTVVNAAGRPSVCSPDASVNSVPQCPQ